MKKIIFILFAIYILSSLGIAQDSPERISRNSLVNSFANTNLLGHSFDVLDYKLNIDVYNSFFSPYPKSYNANLIIKFKVDTALNNINLNAVYASLVIDSVKLYPSNSTLTFSHSSSSNLLNINLDRQYNPNETVQVKIYFRHNNINDQAFYASSGYVFTDFPPQGARKFIPCWDEPYDKATLDLTAKVPLSARLGSNGRLYDSTVTGDTIYYHWISRDPIATYLIVITGKVSYQIDIAYWHKLSNPSDSIPIRFYFLSTQSVTPVKSVINDMTTFYSQKFGEYPFEKVGFAYVPNSVGFPWGGMENQTLITMNNWTEVLASHEYAHMWFGDLITCGTWADVWLNEGFATWVEAYWLEHKIGYANYKSRINYYANQYLTGNPGWAINNPPMSDLYNYPVVYCKGACVLHMLRYVLGDSVYFNCMKSYATDTLYKYKSAVTDEFTSKINAVSGQNLNWFIDEWVKQPNHPVYQNTYSILNISTNNYQFKFFTKQIQTNSPFHKMPIVLKISFSTGSDSLISVLNDLNNQEFTFYFNRQPTNLVFDPNGDIVLKTATTSIGINLVSNEIPGEYKLNQNYPNPFNSKTKIGFEIPKLSDVKLIIYDLSGKEILIPINDQLQPGKYELNLDLTNFASGLYFYKLSANTFFGTKKFILLK